MKRAFRLIWSDWDLRGMVFVFLVALVLGAGEVRALMHGDAARGALALLGLSLLLPIQIAFSRSHKRRAREAREREREKLHG